MPTIPSPPGDDEHGHDTGPRQTIGQHVADTTTRNLIPFGVFCVLMAGGIAMYLTAAFTDGSDALEQAGSLLVGAAVGGAGGILSAKNGK